jgi:hypothetical protein
MRVHHTEYVMPASGMLFANDHDAGRTFIFDLRDPLHPKIVTSFTDMDGYMHPHSYLRLPNGHVLASFQHNHHGEMEGQMGGSGGLVEIDDQGKVIRSASSADPEFPSALLTPYSLVVLPEIDRVVSTNSSMDDVNSFSGVTYQVWRLSSRRRNWFTHFLARFRRANNCRALSGPACAGDAWSDCAGHLEWDEARGSFPVEA